MKLLSIGAAAVPTMLVMAALMAPAPLPADDALLKCRPPAGWTQLDQRYLVDGQFRERFSFGRTRTDRGFTFKNFEVTMDIVQRIEVLCWDAANQVLQRGPGEPVIYITTQPFMAMLHEDLVRIVAAQDAYRKTNSDYAADIADLDVALQATGVTYTLIRDGDGWEAMAASNMLIETCHVFAGSIEPSRDGLAERIPACFVRPELDWQAARGHP
ncbi:MAG TPA: hypothetical protein VMN60_10915 [Longimicrobiales bacterium]|nr:hypothetical protein [Longimicrobiales bacterium]